MIWKRLFRKEPNTTTRYLNNVIMAETQAEAETLFQSIIDFANDNGYQAVEDLMDADYQANVAKVGSGLRK